MPPDTVAFGLAALLAGLTLVPARALSSPAIPAATIQAQDCASAPARAAPNATRADSDEPRRAVRVVYSGPITR